MKKITLLLILGISTHLKAQTLKPDPTTTNPSYTRPYNLIDTVISSKLTKQQLFSNAVNFSIGNRCSIIYRTDDYTELDFRGSTARSFVGKDKNDNGVRIELFYVAKLLFKDNRFKIVLSTLEYPYPRSLTPFGPELQTGVKFPVQLPGSTDIEKHNPEAISMCISLIKDISSKINQNSGEF
ncbi:hypothetical protein AB6735_18530 [Mucilaginibacter sp. RCC_168]|uniref:hypothetical protein n=1 Tax=Mucilaginibacter sp. RCC_168 TaxID=3239221 RepID=UPI00352353BF